MKIGMKEEIGIHDVMTSSVLGSRHAVHSMLSELCEHCYLARSIVRGR